jgi:hypothetical protein
MEILLQAKPWVFSFKRERRKVWSQDHSVLAVPRATLLAKLTLDAGFAARSIAPTKR